jgi:GTP cyclohydrolase II
MEALGASGRVIVYLRQDLGIGLREEPKAYNLQNLGIDIVQANIFSLS